MTKRNKWIVGVIAGVLLAGSAFAMRPKAPVVPETVSIVRQDLARTVEVSGTLKPQHAAALSFGASGRVENVLVKEGDVVRKGQVLARLSAKDLDAQWLRTQESITASKVQWESATRAVADTAATNTAAVAQAQSALMAARVAQQNTQAETVRTYEEAQKTLLLALRSATISLRQALSDADTILGVENTLANDVFEVYLAANNPPALNQAVVAMRAAIEERERMEGLVRRAEGGVLEAELVSSTAAVADALTHTEAVLASTRRVLDATTSNAEAYTLTDVAADRAVVDAARGTLQREREALSSARLAFTQASAGRGEHAQAQDVAVQSAERALAQAQATAWARASESAGTADWRNASLAQARADIVAISADRAERTIVAPFDGTITRVSLEAGERAIPGGEVLRMESAQDTWRGELDVPESDIDSVRLGQAVQVRFDALGDDVVFAATVAHIDPSASAVEGVVYYRVILTLNASPRIQELRTGLSLDADIAVGQASQVLVIPQRVVYGTAAQRMVRVLNADGVTAREQSISIGLRGNNGLVEVREGLEEGDRVLTKR